MPGPAARTLAFTCCNRKYEDFAPLFAASLLTHNPDAAVEIGVEDAARFSAEHAAWSIVTARFPGRTCVREVAWTRKGRRLLPNTVRFLETPLTDSEYVYITDVDFVILKEIAPAHLEIMRRHQAPYSNVVRRSSRRLTGLHFTERAAHYPLPDLSDIPLWSLGDEEVLYEIVKRKGVRMHRESDRPAHGIHISPRRPLFPTVDEEGKVTPGWGIWGYVDRFHTFAESELMLELRPSLSKRIEHCLGEIEKVWAYIRATEREASP